MTTATVERSGFVRRIEAKGRERYDSLDREDRRRWSREYNEWQKHVISDSRLIALAHGKPCDVRITTLAIAMHGTLGRDCYPSAKTLARETGFSERTVKSHRTTVVGLGILWETGGRRQRGVVPLDIVPVGQWLMATDDGLPIHGDNPF